MDDDLTLCLRAMMLRPKVAVVQGRGSLERALVLLSSLFGGVWRGIAAECLGN